MSHTADDSAEGWDRRYTSADRWWSGEPNGALVTEVQHLDPGSALDIGCGEGADAIWLARHGWDVTAMDISQVAIERARRAGSEAGVEVTWVRAELAAGTAPPRRRYQLVSAQYPALRHSPDDDVIGWLLDAVAPGGTLLVVGHALDEHHPRDGFNPADYIQPGDVARHLDAAWTIDVHEVRPRIPPPGHTGPDVADVVLRATRR